MSMKRSRHTPEQVIRKLREADKMLGEGKGVAEVAKQLEVSENTYHRWRKQYGGMKSDDVKRLKELERENGRLKRIVADQALNIDALKEVAKGTGRPGPPASGGRDGLRPPGRQRASGLPVPGAVPIDAASRARDGWRQRHAAG
jgi:transposase-like protein